MTNEEKALDIIFGWADDVQECAKDAAMQMAQWKDQQFKEYLKRKRDVLAEISRLDFYDISHTFGGVKCLDEIINELFGE